MWVAWGFIVLTGTWNGARLVELNHCPGDSATPWHSHSEQNRLQDTQLVLENWRAGCCLKNETHHTILILHFQFSVQWVKSRALYTSGVCFATSSQLLHTTTFVYWIFPSSAHKLHYFRFCPMAVCFFSGAPHSSHNWARIGSRPSFCVSVF